VLFAGYEDYVARGWDVLDPNSTEGPVMNLIGHENRVTTLGVNSEGNALLTGSWDTSLRVRYVA
jgi:guanine nucleotide-binding protein G(I)/G(S)/G(T) subunit beta-1